MVFYGVVVVDHGWDRISNVNPSSDATALGGHVTLRYWASARAAAGTDTDVLDVDGPVTLAALLNRALAAHQGSPKFADVVGCCSLMVGDRPVTTGDPETVTVRPGETVEFLPPFAGG